MEVCLQKIHNNEFEHVYKVDSQSCPLASFYACIDTKTQVLSYYTDSSLQHLVETIDFKDMDKTFNPLGICRIAGLRAFIKIYHSYKNNLFPEKLGHATCSGCSCKSQKS